MAISKLIKGTGNLLKGTIAGAGALGTAALYGNDPQMRTALGIAALGVGRDIKNLFKMPFRQRDKQIDGSPEKEVISSEVIMNEIDSIKLVLSKMISNLDSENTRLLKAERTLIETESETRKVERNAEVVKVGKQKKDNDLIKLLGMIGLLGTAAFALEAFASKDQEDQDNVDENALSSLERFMMSGAYALTKAEQIIAQRQVDKAVNARATAGNLSKAPTITTAEVERNATRQAIRDYYARGGAAPSGTPETVRGTTAAVTGKPSRISKTVEGVKTSFKDYLSKNGDVLKSKFKLNAAKGLGAVIGGYAAYSSFESMKKRFNAGDLQGAALDASSAALSSALALSSFTPIGPIKTAALIAADVAIQAHQIARDFYSQVYGSDLNADLASGAITKETWAQIHSLAGEYIINGFKTRAERFNSLKKEVEDYSKLESTDITEAGAGAAASMRSKYNVLNPANRKRVENKMKSLLDGDPNSESEIKSILDGAQKNMLLTLADRAEKSGISELANEYRKKAEAIAVQEFDLPKSLFEIQEENRKRLNLPLIPSSPISTNQPSITKDVEQQNQRELNRVAPSSPSTNLTPTPPSSNAEMVGSNETDDFVSKITNAALFGGDQEILTAIMNSVSSQKREENLPPPSSGRVNSRAPYNVNNENRTFRNAVRNSTNMKHISDQEIVDMSLG